MSDKAVPPLNSDQGEGSDTLFVQSSATFSGALARLMRVANTDEDGSFAPLKQIDLGKESGVSRASLAKYLSATHADPANPTLEVICKLAKALSIPPAFLMMSSDDWTRLISGMHYLFSVSNDPQFVDFARSVIESGNKFSHSDVAASGVDIATKMKLIQRSYDENGQRISEKQRSKVAASCLAPPMASIDISLRPLLLSLCAIIGATAPLV